MSEKPDTTNRFLVGVQGKDVLILKWNKRLTRAQAMNLGAYLGTMADCSGESDDKFDHLVEALRGV